MDEQEFSLCNPSSFLAAGQLFTILLPMIKTQDELTASLLSDAPPLGVKYLAKSSAFFNGRGAAPRCQFGGTPHGGAGAVLSVRRSDRDANQASKAMRHSRRRASGPR